MPAVIAEQYRIEAMSSSPWPLRPQPWLPPSRSMPPVNQAPPPQPKADPEQPQRLCGNFVIRQAMESWTQTERDAFIAEFGYI